MYPMYNPYQNMLPPQQVLQANGKQSVDAIRMSPNSSVLVLDSTAPIVWLCISDGIGNVNATPYDIAPHTETPPVNSMEQRLSAIEENLAKIMEAYNGKSNAVSVKPKQNAKSDSAD